MNKDDLEIIIRNDPYHQQRKKPSDSELRLFLLEVDNHCPLCGKVLQSKSQRKVNQKLFQIAHIYPNSPTIEQYKKLHNLERLGNTSEDFENKIALCINCHQTQDFHTTRDEYLHLVDLKKKLLRKATISDITSNLELEDDIRKIVDRISKISSEDLSELNYKPIPVVKKFNDNDILLKNKVSNNIALYYAFIKNCIQDLDGNNNLYFDVVASQIRTCFLKIEKVTSDKECIFHGIVEWLIRKTGIVNLEASEIMISFFIQNCEVFNEIS